MAVQYARTHKKPFGDLSWPTNGRYRICTPCSRAGRGQFHGNGSPYSLPCHRYDGNTNRCYAFGRYTAAGPIYLPAGRNSKSMVAYGTPMIHERHRHRYEFNAKYADKLFDGNLHKAGTNPETGLVEMVKPSKYIPGLSACNSIRNSSRVRCVLIRCSVNLSERP